MVIYVDFRIHYGEEKKVNGILETCSVSLHQYSKTKQTIHSLDKIKIDTIVKTSKLWEYGP